MAQNSSRSDVSPLMPTAPMARPSRSRMRTPPGTGMNCPCEAVATALWNAGRFCSRSRIDRKSTRLNSKSQFHLVCRLLLEKKKKKKKKKLKKKEIKTKKKKKKKKSKK